MLKWHCLLQVKVIVSLAFSLLFNSWCYAEQSQKSYIEPTPSWVEHRDLSLNKIPPIDEITNGVFYQLLDSQIKVSDNEKIVKYARYIETVVNQAGVDYTSQINLDFDPTYQKLALNSLAIIRNGQRIDRLPNANISILNRETELENQIYNGTITLNVLLDDIQVGDSIDYSFTRYGDNPVYKGIFAYTRTLNWSVPVENQFVRVLWGKASPLKVSTRNISPNISEIKRGAFTEYQVHMQNVDTLRVASETPGWFEAYGWISFTESHQWEHVVKWAQTLYPKASKHQSIVDIADDIKRQHQGVPEQIVAALQYTQESIRYVGLEMGVNSHVPTPAHETVALKYGDCKDKALLFIALLNALGVDAYPALVNTEETKLLAERLPAVNIFDHVIVQVEFNNEKLWLDPTLNHQQGPLAQLFQPDYGYALVVKEGQSALTSMAQTKHNTHTLIRDSYIIPASVQDAVSYNVVSEYLGNKAQKKHSQIERDGKKKLTQDYEVFYQRTYPGLVKTSDVEITSNAKTGILTLTENYTIDNFWKKAEIDYEQSFYPSEIRNAVYQPKQVSRVSPLWFEYPNNITNEIVITFKETGWDFENDEFIEDNDFFFFKQKVTYVGQVLTLTFDYKSKTDHIPSAEIDKYIAARDILRKNAYYGLTKYANNEENTTEALDENNTFNTWQNWILILSVSYLSGLLFIIISWRVESRKRPEFPENQFFPISLTKFLTLSLVTIGTYNAYWMYRNWLAIKQSDQSGQSGIMPIARGFFLIFWFYPLFTALKNDSENRFGNNKVMLPFLAVLFAVLYICISFSSKYFEVYIVNILVFLLPTLFIPFVHYINTVNGNNSSSYHYNSAWNVRSVIAVIIFSPIAAYSLVQYTPLFPSASVVSQAQIMQRDMKYLYRQNILPVDETIQHFYSDAFFSIRDDGNGFTSKRVFSYWQDDNQGFQSEIARFNTIKNIEVKYAKDDSENTIVTVTRNDNTDFKLFVSSIDGGDKTFVNQLKVLWKAQVSD